MNRFASFGALLKKDAKVMLGDWKACALLILSPVFFILFFCRSIAPMFNKSSFIEPFPIALVDNEKSALTRMLEKQLDEVEIFSEIRNTDEETAVAMLAGGSVGGVVIIPAGFTNSISLEENKPVAVMGNSAMPLQAGVVRSIAQSASNLVSAAQGAIMATRRFERQAGISAGGKSERYDEAAMKYTMAAIDRNSLFDEDVCEGAGEGAGHETGTGTGGMGAGIMGTSGMVGGVDMGEGAFGTDMDGFGFITLHGLTSAEYFTAALITVFMLFAALPGAKSMVAEREGGISSRLSSAPVGAWEIMFSKLATTIMTLSAQSGAIIALTAVFFKNYWGAPPGRIVLLFASAALAACSWSVFTASVSPTTASADIVGCLGVLLMAAAGGCIYPLSLMPRLIRRTSPIMITRWSMEGFMALFSGNDAAWSWKYPFALLAAASIFFVLSIPASLTGRRKMRRG